MISTDASSLSVAMITDLAFFTSASISTARRVALPSMATRPLAPACRSAASRFSTMTMRDFSYPVSSSAVTAAVPLVPYPQMMVWSFKFRLHRFTRSVLRY